MQKEQGQSLSSLVVSSAKQVSVSSTAFRVGTELVVSCYEGIPTGSYETAYRLSRSS
jgi:hypothetical protein